MIMIIDFNWVGESGIKCIFVAFYQPFLVPFSGMN